LLVQLSALLAVTSRDRQVTLEERAESGRVQGSEPPGRRRRRRLPPQQRLGALAHLAEVATHDPEPPQQSAQVETQLRVGLEAPLQRRAQVLLLGLQPIEPGQLPRPPQPRLGLSG